MRFQGLDFHFVTGMGECALIWRLSFDNCKTQEPSHPRGVLSRRGVRIYRSVAKSTTPPSLGSAHRGSLS